MAGLIERRPMKRNRRAGVEDLWFKNNGQRTNRHGVGLRWRARYVDDGGRECTKAFGRKVEAQQWLDAINAQFATGTYLEPAAGRITVATVYQSWSVAQAHISAKTAASRRSSWNSRVASQ
jgi:hypothetical protein